MARKGATIQHTDNSQTADRSEQERASSNKGIKNLGKPRHFTIAVGLAAHHQPSPERMSAWEADARKSSVEGVGRDEKNLT